MSNELVLEICDHKTVVYIFSNLTPVVIHYNASMDDLAYHMHRLQQEPAKK